MLLEVAVKVCKRWREAVGSCGKLWSSSSLEINSRNISPVLTLMSSGMLSRLRSVKVEKVTCKKSEVYVCILKPIKTIISR